MILTFEFWKRQVSKFLAINLMFFMVVMPINLLCYWMGENIFREVVVIMIFLAFWLWLTDLFRDYFFRKDTLEGKTWNG